MVIFRPSGEFLEDGLKKAKEFESEEAMKLYVAEKWNNVYNVTGTEYALTIDDVVIFGMPTCDNRCGWRDTRYVCITKLGKEILEYPACIGFCATDYIKNK